MKIEGEIRLLDGGSIIFIISGTVFTAKTIWIDKRLSTKTPNAIRWGMPRDDNYDDLSPFWRAKFKEALENYNFVGERQTDMSGKTIALKILRGQ